MCRLVSVTFIVIPSSSSSSAIVERRFSNFPRSSFCFSSFLECFFFLKRLNVPVPTTQNSFSCNSCYLEDFGLFFVFSFSWLTLCSLTCFQIPVLFTSSVMLIAEKGMFMMFPLAKGIFKLPVCSAW